MGLGSCKAQFHHSAVRYAKFFFSWPGGDGFCPVDAVCPEAMGMATTSAIRMPTIISTIRFNAPPPPSTVWREHDQYPQPVTPNGGSVHGSEGTAHPPSG